MATPGGAALDHLAGLTTRALLPATDGRSASEARVREAFAQQVLGAVASAATKSRAIQALTDALRARGEDTFLAMLQSLFSGAVTDAERKKSVSEIFTVGPAARTPPETVINVLLYAIEKVIVPERATALTTLNGLFSATVRAGEQTGVFSYIETTGNGNCFYNSIYQLLSPRDGAGEIQFGNSLKASIGAWLRDYADVACGHIDTVGGERGIRPLFCSTLPLAPSKWLPLADNTPMTLRHWVALHGEDLFLGASLTRDTPDPAMLAIARRVLNISRAEADAVVVDAYESATVNQRFDIMVQTVTTDGFWAGQFHVAVCATYLQRNIVTLNTVPNPTGGASGVQLRCYRPAITYQESMHPMQSLYVMQTATHYQALFIHKSPTSEEAATAEEVYAHLIGPALAKRLRHALHVAMDSNTQANAGLTAVWETPSSIKAVDTATAAVKATEAAVAAATSAAAAAAIDAGGDISRAAVLVLSGVDPTHGSPGISAPDADAELYSAAYPDAEGTLYKVADATLPYGAAMSALLQSAADPANKGQWTQATRYGARGELTEPLEQMNLFWKRVCKFMTDTNVGAAANRVTTAQLQGALAGVSLIGQNSPSEQAPPPPPPPVAATPPPPPPPAKSVSALGTLQSQRYANALLPYVNLMRLFYMSTSVGGTRPPQYLEQLQYDHTSGRDTLYDIYVAPRQFAGFAAHPSAGASTTAGGVEQPPAHPSAASFMQYAMAHGYLPDTGRTRVLDAGELGAFAHLLDAHAERDAASVYERRNASSAIILLLHDEQPELSMLLLAYPMPENPAERDILAPPGPYYVVSHADTLRPLYGASTRAMFASRSQFERYVQSTGFSSYFFYQDNMHSNALVRYTADERRGMVPNRMALQNSSTKTDPITLKPTSYDQQLYVVVQWLEIYNAFSKYALDTETVGAAERRPRTDSLDADRVHAIVAAAQEPPSANQNIQARMHAVAAWLLAGGRNYEQLYATRRPDAHADYRAWLQLPLTAVVPCEHLLRGGSKTVAEAYGTGLIQAVLGDPAQQHTTIEAALQHCERALSNQAFHAVVGSDMRVYAVFGSGGEASEPQVFRMAREGVFERVTAAAAVDTLSFSTISVTAHPAYAFAFTRLAYTPQNPRRRNRFTCRDASSYAAFRRFYVDTLGGAEPERVFAECVAEAVRAAPDDVHADEVQRQVHLNAAVRAACRNWKRWAAHVSTAKPVPYYAAVHVALATLLDARIATASTAEALREMHSLLYGMTYARTDAFGSQRTDLFRVRLGNYDESVRLLVGCNWALRGAGDPLIRLVVTPHTAEDAGEWSRTTTPTTKQVGYRVDGRVVLSAPHSAEIDDSLQLYVRANRHRQYERTNRGLGAEVPQFESADATLRAFTTTRGSSFWLSVSVASLSMSVTHRGKTTQQVARLIRRQENRSEYRVADILAGKTLPDAYAHILQAPPIQYASDTNYGDSDGDGDSDGEPVLSTAPSAESVDRREVIPLIRDMRQSHLAMRQSQPEAATPTGTVVGGDDDDAMRVDVAARTAEEMVTRREHSATLSYETKAASRGNAGYVFYGAVPISMVEVGAATRKVMLAHEGRHAAVSEFMQATGRRLFRGQPTTELLDDADVVRVFRHLSEPSRVSNPRASTVPQMLAEVQGEGRASLTERPVPAVRDNNATGATLFTKRYRGLLREMSAPPDVELSAAFSTDPELSAHDALALIWYLHRKRQNFPLLDKQLSNAFEQFLYKALPRSGSAHLFSSFFRTSNNLRTFRAESPECPVSIMTLGARMMNYQTLSTKQFVEVSVLVGDLWYAPVGPARNFPASSAVSPDSFSTTNRYNLILPRADINNITGLRNVRRTQYHAATMWRRGDSYAARYAERRKLGRVALVDQLRGASDLAANYEHASKYAVAAEIAAAAHTNPNDGHRSATYWTPVHAVLHWLILMYRDLDWTTVGQALAQPKIWSGMPERSALLSTGYLALVPSNPEALNAATGTADAIERGALTRVPNVLEFLDAVASRKLPPAAADRESGSEHESESGSPAGTHMAFRQATKVLINRMLQVATSESTSKAHITHYYTNENSRRAQTGEARMLFFAHLQALIGAELFYDKSRPGDDTTASTFNKPLHRQLLDEVLSADPPTSNAGARAAAKPKARARAATKPKASAKSKARARAAAKANAAKRKSMKPKPITRDHYPAKQNGGQAQLGVPSDMEFYAPVTGYVLPSIAFLRGVGMQAVPADARAKSARAHRAAYGRIGARRPSCRAINHNREAPIPSQHTKQNGGVSNTGGYYPVFSELPAKCVGSSGQTQLFLRGISAGDVQYYDAPQWCLLTNTVIESGAVLDSLSGMVWLVRVAAAPDADSALYNTSDGTPALVPTGEFSWAAYMGSSSGEHYVVEVDARLFSNSTRYVRYTATKAAANVEFVRYDPAHFDVGTGPHNTYLSGLNNDNNVWQGKLAMWALRTTRQVAREEELLIHYDVGQVVQLHSLVQAKVAGTNIDDGYQSAFPITQPRMHHPNDIVGDADDTLPAAATTAAAAAAVSTAV